MAIDPNNTITYNDLKTNVLAWLKRIPKNVGSYASGVHASLRDPNWSKVLTSKDYNWEYRYNPGRDNKMHTANRYTTHIDLIATINSLTLIPVVTAAQIESDFNAFLDDSRVNINARKNAIVTTSGLLNFWDNVICFLYRHLVNVASNDAPNGVLMYWSASTYRYKYVTKLTDNNISKPSETEITAQDILDMLTTLENTYNFAQRTHIIQYKITENKSVSLVASGVAPGWDSPEGNQNR